MIARSMTAVAAVLMLAACGSDAEESVRNGAGEAGTQGGAVGSQALPTLPDSVRATGTQGATSGASTAAVAPIGGTQPPPNAAPNATPPASATRP
ncbi:MAG TPA: hypothetical protein VEA99_19185 [Gemmatimonadaceae bacterium]|nr:hypothetical protein [Gemmatimonadaceae bacterium]